MALNNFKTTTINWDKASRKLNFEEIRTASNDINGRKLKVKITNSGLVEDLTGINLNLYWEARSGHPNGLDAFKLVNAKTGEFEIEYTTEMVSNIGKLKVNLQLVDKIGTTTSESFDIQVFKGINEQAIQGSNSFTALNQALVKVNGWNDRIDIVEQDYAERAEKLEETYAPKLTNVTEQLAEKPNKGNVSVSDINKNLGKFDQTYMTDEFLQQLTDGSPVNAIPSDYSLVEKKFAIPILLGLASKNLFNKNTATNGYYIDYSNGNLSPSGNNVASDYIPVLSNTEYTKRGSYQLAFYNSSKSYLSGLSSAKTFTTPPETSYVRLTTTDANFETEQMELGGNATTYESFFSKLDPSTIPDGTITKKMVDINFMEGTPSKNLFDKSMVTLDRYVDYSSGTLVLVSGYVASDFIVVEPNETYTKVDNAQFAFYNSDKFYISGLANAKTFTTPENCYFVRISVRVANIEIEQLESGSISTSYESFGTKLVYDALPSKLVAELITPTKITVSKDGSMDFVNLRNALESITDASATKRYEVHISDGDYDIFSDYTTAEIDDASFIGLRIPNYVDLIGTGKKENTIIRGELADTFSNATKMRVALSKFGEGILKNITFIGKNTRYALHDDYNYPNTKRKVINCDFIKEIGGGLNVAYGGGAYSGMEFEFEDSCFYTESNSYPFSFHNNVNFAKSCSWKLKNCSFENKNGEWVIRFGSMGSGNVDTIEMLGCKLGGKILINEEVANSGVGIDFKLKGYGNSIVPVEFIQTSGTTPTYEFINETEKVYNVSAVTIAKGTLVKLYSKGKPVVPLLTTDTEVLFHGVACEDILSGEFGVIRKSGYLPVSDTELDVSIGDKIGVVNGVLSVVTNGDYVGYVELSNYITLK